MESRNTHILKNNIVKGHSFYKQCLHDLQFIKTRSLCRHCLQNEWTLDRLGLVKFLSKIQKIDILHPEWSLAPKPKYRRTHIYLGFTSRILDQWILMDHPFVAPSVWPRKEQIKVIGDTYGLMEFLLKNKLINKKLEYPV